MPLWQMAVSLALFGINALALRLPSAILSTAAVWLTYAIGRNLLGRMPALIAAALQAFNPAIINLVHGISFQITWTSRCFSGWRCRSTSSLGRSKWSHFGFRRCGFAQGVAFLCKTYPALIVTGLAALAYIVSLRIDSSVKARAKHLVALLLVTLVTIAPWTIYTLVNFRREFMWENAQIFRHLGQTWKAGRRRGTG
jgi:4-amino-4-deoxy-L-arabinose transferase